MREGHSEQLAVVASERASAIRASNFTTMCFMVVRLSPLQFTRSMSGNFHKSHPVIFYWARRRNFDANQLVIGPPLGLRPSQSNVSHINFVLWQYEFRLHCRKPGNGGKACA